ncbi:MAG: protoporphyrinogen oxidase [Candidatus Hydrogenedentes bacterium]|nr:protoporphyrinogen oxidase [Candidatus Hydrogenedentota bacterium]
MAEDARFVVIGGGVSGLCTGFYLARQFGAGEVVVLEAGEVPGGTARTEETEGFRCEWGPNGFLDREPLTLQWVEDLGLKDQLIQANEAASHRYVLKGNRLVEIKPPPAFLFSPILSLRGKARLLCEPLIEPVKDDSPESIWHFAARRIGREAADTMVQAMVSGIFAGDAKQLSLQHCFPRMAQMEREYGSLFKALKARKKGSTAAMGPGGTLTSFAGGIATLPRAVAAALGESLRLGTPVAALSRSRDRFVVDTTDGRQIRAEFVVMAAPSYAAAKILQPLDNQLDSVLNGIGYADITVVCCGYKRARVGRDLNGFGFLVPRTQKKRVLGSLWTSSIFANRAPEGYALFRNMFGGYTDPEAARLPDDELIKLVQQEIHPLLRIAGPPDFVRIFRHRPGIPQYLLGHDTRLAALDSAEQRHRGLIFAGNAYRGVGINDCVVSAHRAVERITALAGD